MPTSRYILPIFLAIVHIALFVPTVAATDLICEYCKRPITGQYIEVDGKYYHPDHFLCEKCRASIGTGQYYKENGKYYCPDCYLKYFAPRCAFCNRHIEGRYVMQDGKMYHEACFNRHVALRCALCGEIIQGQYIQDFWGNAYCAKHEGEVPQCESCGRFISQKLTNGGVELADGRHVCGICLRTAIIDFDEAKHLLETVRDHLGRAGIVIRQKNITLHLVNQRELSEVSPSHWPDQLGLAAFEERETSAYISRTFDVYILSGLPRITFIAVAAHELMHVWQYLESPRGNDPALCEGSCQYAASLVLQNYGGKEVEYNLSAIANDSSEIYGEGYRRVKRLVERRGVDGWLAVLRSESDFPSGY